MSLRVAIVCPRPELRMTAAKAFDSAPIEWDLCLVTEPPEKADVVVAVGTDVPGALLMDLAAPEAVVDEIQRAGVPRVVAVIGASGGCGTTSVALHLAAAMTHSKRVNVVDLQSDRGAALRTGLDSGEPRSDGGPVLLPVTGGFRVAFAPGGAGGPAACIAAASTGVDSLILDLPVEHLAGIAAPDRVVLVMTPTVPSATRGALLIQQHPALAWVPITNRTGPGSETTRVDIERILGRRLAMELPCSPGLRDAEDDLSLLGSPLSPWWMRVRRLGAAL